MFVEPAEPTFEQKRDETKPTLHLAAAESPFSPQKREMFGNSGGAVAFSLAPCATGSSTEVNFNFNPLKFQGVAAERLVTVGLAGSRLLVEDTESEQNDLNRRVEVHLDSLA